LFMHGHNAYLAWISTNESSPGPSLESGEQTPNISVLLPVYNTPERHLRTAIESVCRQSYDNWELCIADDASTAKHVRSVLEEYADNNPRIKLLFRDENGNISAASNSALTLAQGEYITLLDHDDELAPHALAYVAEAIIKQPSSRFLYSDEDKIDEDGNRSSPYFKCGWNPDLLRSQNYIAHLMVIDTELVRSLGGFRTAYDGSQDHDLALRCTARLQPSEIVHIPRILYHWRQLPSSTALAPDAKSYTTQAGLRALSDFFAGLGQPAVTVSRGQLPNTYHVRYPLPDPAPMVSLIVPTRDQLALLNTCVRSILSKTLYPHFELIIVDNQSEERETREWLARIESEDDRVRVLSYDDEFNFSAINNFAVELAAGEIIGLVNNDIEVISPDWLNEMVGHACRPEIGCVGAKLYYDDDRIQHAGVILGVGGVAGHAHKYFPRFAHGYFSRAKLTQNLSAVTGACLIVRKSVYQEVGGLDITLKVAFNDVDFCVRVRNAGYRNLWTPHAELYHHESKSRGQEDTPEKRERFRSEVELMRERWGEMLDTDPYYSPHLTLKREDFSIRIPGAG